MYFPPDTVYLVSVCPLKFALILARNLCGGVVCVIGIVSILLSTGID